MLLGSLLVVTALQVTSAAVAITPAGSIRPVTLPQVSSSGLATLVQAEAVATDWNAAAPPATGWVPVKLVDYWNKRWPRHDGVVWYRLHWNQTDANAPVGLLIDYACMADAVWVNGSLVYRDPHLIEPLSRAWVAPQYFLVDKPLLHAGENTMLIRVSGMAAYQPGLGRVRVGAASAVHRLYEQGMFWRFNIHLFNFALSAVLGVLFLMFWLVRRKETVFGWYALTTLIGAAYAWNWVAPSPWPFVSTDAFEAMISALFVASVFTFCVFLLRFCERRWPRTEAVLLLFAVSAVAMALFAPQIMGPWRNLWDLPIIVVYYTATLIFLWHAVRTPRADIRVMGICLLVPVLISFFDLMVYLELSGASSNADLGAVTSPLTLIGMGFAIAWRFSGAMRRVEGFNVELTHKVQAATASLSQTLSREHALALSNTRIGERLSLVRDLHDGFGGSLLAAIASLERSSSPESVRTIITLKELREDLRLVIDTTTHTQDTDLAGLLAPLRHRWSQRLETAGIKSHWRVEALDGVQLSAAHSLDLLRFLQEALTNALKHSGAALVDVCIRREGERLHAEVRDDGRGFDPDARATGAGLASLRARAARLHGQLVLRTSPGQGASLQLDAHLPERVSATAAPAQAEPQPL